MKTYFKEKTLSLVLRSILLGCPIAVAPHTFAAVSGTQSQESNANWGISSIGAHHAYEKGYTGKGIAVGVADTDFPAGIEELLNKVKFIQNNTNSHDPNLEIGKNVLPDFKVGDYNHGAHVSGIIAAKKNNKGMHGVAYDADIYAQNMNDNISEMINTTPVRVINNSWGREDHAFFGVDASNPKNIPVKDLDGIDGKAKHRVIDYKRATSKTTPKDLLDTIIDNRFDITIRDVVESDNTIIFDTRTNTNVDVSYLHKNGAIAQIKALRNAAKNGVVNVFAAGNYNHYNEPGAFQGLPIEYTDLLKNYLTVANLTLVRSEQIEVPENTRTIQTSNGDEYHEVELQGKSYWRKVNLEVGAEDYLFKIDQSANNLWIERTDILVNDDSTKENLYAGSSQCGYTALWCVSAPGTGIYSSTFAKDANNELIDNYEYMTGTSMAAPHATGALAVLMQRFPYMSAADVNSVLKTTTQDMDENGAVTDGSARVIDKYFGWGKIDLEKAIKGPAMFASSDDVKNMLEDDVKRNLGNDLDKLADAFGNGDFYVNMGKGVVYDKGTPRERTCDTKECEFDTWSNDIFGSGGLIKDGSGTLQLTGSNTYKNDTRINEGGLDLVGSMTSNLLIGKSGILSGQGQSGNVDIKGGKFIPSRFNTNGFSTFTIHGDIKFSEDSTYSAKIKDENEQVDKLVVKGKAYLNNANFNAYEKEPDNLLTKNDMGRYQGNEYTLIDAEKIDQSFNNNFIDSITTDDVKPELVKADEDKKLKLQFKDLAAEKEAERLAKEKAEQEAKEKAEKEAKEKAEKEAREKAEQEAKDKAEQEAKDKAEKEAKDKAEQEAKDKAEQEAKDKAEQEAKDKAEKEAKEEAERLAKEEAERKAKEEADKQDAKTIDSAKAEKAARIASIQGDVLAEEFHDLDHGRQLINNRLRYVQRNEHSNNVWVEVQDSSGKSKARSLNNFANTKSHQYDVDNTRISFGADTNLDDWTVGLMGTINSKDIDAKNDASAKVDNYQFGIYAGKSFNNVNLRLSGALGRNEVDSTYYDKDDGQFKAKYNGRTYQVNTEVGYAFKLDDLHFEPFVGLSYDYVKNNKFSQNGNQISLVGDERSYNRVSSQLGLDVSKKWKFSDTTNISLNGGLAWQHSFKDIDEGAKLKLVSNNGIIAGNVGYVDVPYTKDSALVNIGLSSDIKNTHEFFINYEGNFAEKYQENGVVFKYNFKF